MGITSSKSANQPDSAEGVDHLETQLPTNQILYKIFRASESGVMVYPKALTSKTS